MRYRQKNGSLVVLALVLSSVRDEMEKFIGDEKMKDAKWLEGGKLDLNATRDPETSPSEDEVATTHDWIVREGAEGDGRVFAMSPDEFSDTFESLSQAEERDAAGGTTSARTIEDLDKQRFDDEGGDQPNRDHYASSSSSPYRQDGRGTTDQERYNSGALSISTTNGGTPQFDDAGKFSADKTEFHRSSSSSPSAQASANGGTT